MYWDSGTDVDLYIHKWNVHTQVKYSLVKVVVVNVERLPRAQEEVCSKRISQPKMLSVWI